MRVREACRPTYEKREAYFFKRGGLYSVRSILLGEMGALGGGGKVARKKSSTCSRTQRLFAGAICQQGSTHLRPEKKGEKRVPALSKQQGYDHQVQPTAEVPFIVSRFIRIPTTTWEKGKILFIETIEHADRGRGKGKGKTLDSADAVLRQKRKFFSKL